MGQLKSMKYRFKNYKNKILNDFYLRKSTTDMHPNDAGDTEFVVVSITFEKPEITEWQIQAFKQFMPQVRLMIFDNSSSLAMASEIKSVAQKYGIHYTKLPSNKTKHPNRSHALALNWIYKHYILKAQPRFFGFVDHDLIPFCSFDLRVIFDKQPFYGLQYQGNNPCWYLWAGYHFYKFDFMKQQEVNFMYDFQNELDTAGWNYRTIFRNMDCSGFQFASNEFIDLQDMVNTEQQANTQVQVIDRAWLHIGGIGYNENYKNKLSMINTLRNNPIELSTAKHA